MKTTALSPRGYCKGVVRAIKMAKEATQTHKPLTILGMIVHNEYIVNALKALGANTVEDAQETRIELLDHVSEGTIMITAHGASDEVTQKAQAKGLTVIDATCLDVIKTHDLIKAALKEGKDVLYIGKAHHPESEGALAIDTQHVHLIESVDDFKSLDRKKTYVMTNQTTMSLYDVVKINEAAKTYFQNVEIAQEICPATRVRQNAIASMSDDIDVVFIVGDPRSNNTKKLAAIAREQAHKETYMIESITQLDLAVLKGKKHAAVSSGASTPTYLTNQVIAFLQQYDEQDPTTWQKPEVDYTRILL